MRPGEGPPPGTPGSSPVSGLTYPSGEDVRAGDSIQYQGEPGIVDFVVTGATGDEDRDWFLEEHPGGGVMLLVRSLGSVFVGAEELDESLQYLARSR